jgi:hypothetical protein
MGTKITKFIGLSKPKQEHMHTQFQIQITKQQQKKKQHNICKTKFQQNFVAIMKQK